MKLNSRYSKKPQPDYSFYHTAKIRMKKNPAHSHGLKLVLLVVCSLLYLTGCLKEDEKRTYNGYALSHYELLSDPYNYETYIQSNQPQNNSDFYACLDTQYSNASGLVNLRIAQCRDICGDDSICMFDCETQNGVELLEAHRDLIGNTKTTLAGNGNYAILVQDAALVSDFMCIGINAARSVASPPLPQLPCDEIWDEIRADFINQYTCTFTEEKYIWE